jgi:hypothetical protein
MMTRAHAEVLRRLRRFDRRDLAVVLRVLNAAHGALRLDDDGWTIRGKRGVIVCNNGLFTLHIGCGSRRHWVYAKKMLAGRLCTLTCDGYDTGALRLDRLPSDDEEAALVRHACGLRQHRPSAADHLARFRFAPERTLERPTPSGDQGAAP